MKVNILMIKDAERVLYMIKMDWFWNKVNGFKVNYYNDYYIYIICINWSVNIN